MYNSNPKNIKQFQEGLNETLKDKEKTRFYYLLDVIADKGWIDSDDTSPKHILSPLMYQLSSHYALQDHCKESHPEIDAVKCAITYGYIRKYEEYDEIQKYRAPDREQPIHLRPVVEVIDPEYSAYKII
jgi:hypothetical protein